MEQGTSYNKQLINEVMAMPITLRLWLYFMGKKHHLYKGASMEHVIELTNGIAKLLEYFGEAENVGEKYVGIDGDEEWASIKVQCTPLYEWIFNNNCSPGPPSGVRVQNIISQINQSKVIETPVFYSPTNEAEDIELIDGRHRICALHQLGAKSIVIMVPESQQEMFYNQFGQG